MIRVLVVDDQALVRAGFCALLEATDGVEVVGEAADGVQAIDLVEQLSPDVVLMDIRMPKLDGISATRRLTEGADPPRVLILTTFDTDDNVFEALEAGAVGFLVKDTPPAQLLDAVRAAVAGGAVISPVTTRRLVDRIVASRPAPRALSMPSPSNGLNVLTDREREVLQMIARGQSNREIAGSLFISELTAKTHVSRVSGQARADQPRSGGGARLRDGAGATGRRTPFAVRRLTPFGRRGTAAAGPNVDHMSQTSTTRAPIVTVRGLRKSYGARQVLHDISFDVHAGEILGIVGRNGMGKTSTVEVIQGLRDRDGGEVLVAGMDPGRHRHRLRDVIGSQLQSCALPDRLRVDEALRLFARLAGDVVDWRMLRDEWALGSLGSAAYGGLSGGERQRLFIALALVNRPRLVFLDELTQGLDPAARRDTWRLVDRVRDQGATVVLVTHDMDEAEHLADRLVLVHEGRVAASGTPDQLVARFGGPVRIGFTVTPDALAGLECLPGVSEVAHDGTRASALGNAASVVTLAAELSRRGLAPEDFTVTRPALEDVFLSLTGPALTDVAPVAS